MNPGICYVYEYDNNQRKRNVGFLKITRHYQSCILQIHVRGLPVGNGTSLELCAFYLSGSDMIGAPVASLTCFSRSISVRLPIAESHFPEHRPLSRIDGFLIRLPGGRDSVCWAASERNFDADLRHMLPPEDKKASPPAGARAKEPDETEESGGMPPEGNTESSAALPPSGGLSPEDSPVKNEDQNGAEPPQQLDTGSPEPIQMPEHTRPPEDTFSPAGPPPEGNVLPAESSSPQENPRPEESSPPAESPSPQENTRPKESALRQMDSPSPERSSLPDRDPASTDPETVQPSDEDDSILRATEQDSHAPAARKIQRSDISKLPRRFWFLANNSFLLHGYHNYNHLLLVEEDGHVWLGVPGIYDVREARAADLFGFSQFTRSYAPMLGLSEDERNDEADFGHWCRYLDSDGNSK